MNLPVLYSFRRCPYAMRARMALDVAEINVEHREVLLRDKPKAMLYASPKGTVPILVLPDNSVIDESLDVMLWALGQHDPENWLVSSGDDIAKAEQFLNTFKDALDRYKYASRYDESLLRGALDLDHREIAMRALLDLARPLEKSNCLCGPDPQLLDIATFPFVRQFAAVEPDWWKTSAPPGLQTWLTSRLESPRFRRIMKKHPLWSQANA